MRQRLSDFNSLMLTIITTFVGGVFALATIAFIYLHEFGQAVVTLVCAGLIYFLRTRLKRNRLDV